MKASGTINLNHRRHKYEQTDISYYSNLAGFLLYDGPVTICMDTKNKE